MKNKYPIYIVSKGRAEHQQTSNATTLALTRMRLPHNIVIEEQEYEIYEEHKTPLSRLIILDKTYQKDYDTFDDLGDTKSKGPGPARNFAWDHSISEGHEWHWVMDDNIKDFYRINDNIYHRVRTPAIFKASEDFVNRYTNIDMAGLQYKMFIARHQRYPPYVINTRIYSCNLIKNSLDIRWRGRYNEDTDISLRIMKAGNCTVQFNAFLQDKTTTQQIKGGNTGEFYDNEGTLPKSQILVDMHPDVSEVVYKYGRWHHYVDYNPFKYIKLKRKPGIVIPEGVNEYGMVLKWEPEFKDVPLNTEKEYLDIRDDPWFKCKNVIR